MTDTIAIPGTNGKTIPTSTLANMSDDELASLLELSDDPLITNLMNRIEGLFQPANNHHLYSGVKNPRGIMFGNNPIRKQFLDEKGALYVSEVFHTIQGEGPLAGTPAIFVRLSGCNLQCEFCDTDFETVRNLMNVTELTNKIMKAHHTAGGAISLIVITGGEPFIQNIVPLINRLTDRGFEVQIETAGTVTIQPFPWNKVTVVVSPKTGKVHEHFRLMSDNWKYIISASSGQEIDGLPCKVARPPTRLETTTWVQPMDQHDDTENLLNKNLCVRLAISRGYRISLQTHKILGVD